MVVRDSGVMTLSSPSLTANGATVSDVNDANDSVVFITGQGNDDTARSDINDALFIADFNASSSQPEFERADGDVTAYVSYAVVEFTGINWEVQRSVHTYSSAGTVETEAIAAIPSVNRGFVHAQKMVGEGLNGLDEMGHQVRLSALSCFIPTGIIRKQSFRSHISSLQFQQPNTSWFWQHQSNGTIAQNGPLLQQR